MEQFNDKSKWINGQNPPFDIYKAENVQYGVSGSPSLIVNGVELQPNGRNPQQLLDTVCAGFKTPPAECAQKLSPEEPSPGFGSSNGGSAGGANSASCGK